MSVYAKTARVGVVAACLRLIEDRNRPLWQRILMVFVPFMIVWMVSPFDLLSSAVLGPLGLADDGVMLITIFLLVKLAVSFYGTKKYVRPTHNANGQEIIDV